jgi:DNA repair exonuclease SbcCD ATPase subunit
LFGRGLVFAGIFGGNNNSDRQQQQQQQQQKQLPRKPPPPPPPLQPITSSKHDNVTLLQQQQQQPPPPPPLLSTIQQPPDAYQQQLYMLQLHLDESLQREHHLFMELQNLTLFSDALQQREALHMHQLDVLTERIVDVENSAAHAQNQVLELSANCTELAQQLAQSNAQVDQYRIQCEQLLQLRKNDTSRIAELQQKVKNANRKAQDLAAMMERHRLNAERQKKIAFTAKKKKNRNFLAWMLGFYSDDEDDEENHSDPDQDIEEAYETGRSTLLAALQEERENVLELETLVDTLQANHSAMSEQIQSRNDMIQELNQRISSFEEDKVVLKAALRQLQLDLSEQTPKLDKLKADRKAARAEVERLTQYVSNLTQQHQQETSRLEKMMEQNHIQIRDMEANLTAMSTYVDKLEERLADYTVAKRDMEIREQTIGQLESKIQSAEQQKNALQKRVEELELEHESLKSLLSELVDERTRLKKQQTDITKERDALKHTVQHQQNDYSELQAQSKQWNQTSEELRSRVEAISLELNATIENRNYLLHELQMYERDNESLRRQIQDLSQHHQSLDAVALEEAMAARKTLETRIADLEQELLQAIELRDRIKKEANDFVEQHNMQLNKAKTEYTQEIQRLKNEQKKEFESLVEHARTQAEREKQEQTQRFEKQLMEKQAALERAEQTIAKLSAAKPPPPPVKEHPKPNAIKINEELGASKIDEVKTWTGSVEPEIATNLTGSLRNTLGRNSSDVKSAEIAQNMTSEALEKQLNSTIQKPHVKRRFGVGLAMNQTQTIRPPTGAVNRTLTSVSNTTAVRKVPLRKFRKFFAKTTGIHGLFTPPSTASRKLKNNDGKMLPKVQKAPINEKPNQPQAYQKDVVGPSTEKHKR